jgi:hypothetical protein
VGILAGGRVVCWSCISEVVWKVKGEGFGLRQLDRVEMEDAKSRGLSATGQSKRLPFIGLYGAERKTILVCPKVRNRQSLTVGP